MTTGDMAGESWMEVGGQVRGLLVGGPPEASRSWPHPAPDLHAVALTPEPPPCPPRKPPTLSPCHSTDVA